MKQFIVLTAVLPILMVFVMQTAYDQKNSYAVGIIHDMVYVAKEEARLEGSFTHQIQDKLRNALSNSLNVPKSEITIVCREVGDILYYRVEVPIKDVIAGNGLFGIKDRENQYMYVIDSYTKSRPQPEDDDGDGGDDEGNSE